LKKSQAYTAIQRSPRYLLSRNLNGEGRHSSICMIKKPTIYCVLDYPALLLSKLPDFWFTMSNWDHQSRDAGLIASVLTTKIVPPSTRFRLLRTALTIHRNEKTRTSGIHSTYIHTINRGHEPTQHADDFSLPPVQVLKTARKPNDRNLEG